jgi:hypothetical protein
MEETSARTEEQDLELWKHFAGFGGEDKNRMVTIASWLLGFSAALLAFAAQRLVDPEACKATDHLRIVGAVTLLIGILASLLTGYVAVLYGGYANRNWDMADRIARQRGWSDLVPDKSDLSGRGWHVTAWRWARSCQPREELPPVFLLFLVLAGLALLAHLGIFVWTVIAACPGVG